MPVMLHVDFLTKDALKLGLSIYLGFHCFPCPGYNCRYQCHCPSCPLRCTSRHTSCLHLWVCCSWWLLRSELWAEWEQGRLCHPWVLPCCPPWWPYSDCHLQCGRRLLWLCGWRQIRRSGPVPWVQTQTCSNLPCLETRINSLPKKFFFSSVTIIYLLKCSYLSCFICIQSIG